MNYRIDKQVLLNTMEQWNTFLKRKVHLIACGGTAMTLLGVKPSTKDIDFMVPNVKEYNYLTNVLKDLGYKPDRGPGWKREGEEFIFDLFQGNYIHTTELLESPLLSGNHRLLREYSHLYIGILNEYDLIASKLFRGTGVDFEDCITLVQALGTSIDIVRLESHYRELASYEPAEGRVVRNLDWFLDILRERGII